MTINVILFPGHSYSSNIRRAFDRSPAKPIAALELSGDHPRFAPCWLLVG